MRVCPNCKHEEHPMWRPRRSRVFCDYTKTETLEYNQPELYKKLLAVHPTPYFDGHFIYHITRTGLNVEKIEKSLYDFMKWGKSHKKGWIIAKIMARQNFALWEKQ